MLFRSHFESWEAFNLLQQNNNKIGDFLNNKLKMCQKDTDATHSTVSLLT
jgi:hypothetical protein